MIKNIKLLLCLVSLVFVLQGCAVPALATQPMSFNSNSEKGLLVGSVTFPQEKAGFNGYYFRLTANTSDEFQLKPSQIGKIKHLGQLDNGRTYLFAIERPVGKNEMPSVRLFTNSGVVLLQGTNYVGGFSIPYEIKKGEITYVGNILFNEYAQQGEKVISLQNNLERDINKLNELQPSIDWSKINSDSNTTILYNNKKARL